MSLNWRVRPAEAKDEAEWRRLWKDYCDFYDVSLAPEVTDALWERIVDAHSSVYAVVAEDIPGRSSLVGFGNYVLHPYTWGQGVMCHLEDLFVAEAARRKGAGRSLIEALIKMGYDQGWTRVYWHTHESHETARSFYEKVTALDPFVRYVVHLR